MNEFLTSDEGRNFAGEIFAIGDSIGGILLYEALAKNAQEVNGPGPISRNSSSISAHSSPYFSSGGKEASLNVSFILHWLD